MDHASKPLVSPVGALLKGPWPVVALLGCHFLLGLSAANQKSATFDEIIHLTSGYSYWATGDYRMDFGGGQWPERWAVLPVWLEGYHFPSLAEPTWQIGREWGFGDLLFYHSGNDADAMLLQARAMIGLWSVALGLLVYLWSRQLFGGIGGLISLTLYAFSPTMLSNGFLVTSDLSVGLFFCAAVWSLWALLHRISWFTLIATCFSLAGLFLSKFSAVMVIPMGLLMLAVRWFNPDPLVWAIGRPRQIRGRLPQLAIFFGAACVQFLVVVLLIWATYGFRYSIFQPFAGANATRLVPWAQYLPENSLARSCLWFARDHCLLPEGYLYGFEVQQHWVQSREAFLNGAFGLHGWVLFFPYALLVKTPLEVFLLLILAMATALACFLHPAAAYKDDGSLSVPPKHGGLYSVSPLLILLGIYWIFSLTSQLNIGLRHILPTYPPMFILAGVVAAWFQSPQTCYAKQKAQAGEKSGIPTPSKSWFKVILAARVLVVASLVLTVVEALGCWPNYLAYFNFLAGGTQNGYKHLVDSSLDWGQDLKELKRWLDVHAHEAKPPEQTYLAYFGMASPEYYGIKAVSLPGYFLHYQPHVPEPLTGGIYCVSATLLEGVYLSYPGKWNEAYEKLYQESRHNVLAFQQAVENPAAMKQLLAGVSQKEIDNTFKQYENLRFARLCSFLRQKEPNDNVGGSILIYRLSDADVEQSLEGAPLELLPDCEPDARECLPKQ